jgi:integrating conjugative element protein (TIGR03757 family)
MGATIWLESAVYRKIINIIVSSGQCAAWVSVCLMMFTAVHAETIVEGPTRIEVFISAKHSIVEINTKGVGSNLRGSEIIVYEIDGIQSVERDLSLNLSADTQQSKQIALQRIQNMDEQTRLKMQFAATALAKAMQYGIDRYPAIVFNGQAVVYGITDLQTALAHYQAWRTGEKP